MIKWGSFIFVGVCCLASMNPHGCMVWWSSPSIQCALLSMSNCYTNSSVPTDNPGHLIFPVGQWLLTTLYIYSHLLELRRPSNWMDEINQLLWGPCIYHYLHCKILLMISLDILLRVVQIYHLLGLLHHYKKASWSIIHCIQIRRS